MMTAIISETRGLTHVKAAEGDVDYLMSTCDQDGACEAWPHAEAAPGRGGEGAKRRATICGAAKG